jgi:hypothetical protein
MNLRTKPRTHETISIGGRTKWRLDALCLAGRRSRTATVEVLLDFYFRHNPAVRDFVEERMNDPHPVQLKATKNPVDSADAEPTGERI